MNIFIYDSYLSEKKYSSSLSKIETRITDLGLNGKIIRLSLLKNVISSIDNEIKRGAKTLIAVGNNHTLNKVLNSLCSSNHPEALNIPVFIIPVGKENNEIANNLGIDNFLNACEVLSSRRIEEINTVMANNNYFLSEAKINTVGTKVEIDKNFTIEILDQGNIIINNLNLNNKIIPENISCSPTDDKIELFIQSKKEKKIKSVFSFKELIIESKNKNLILDRSEELKTPILLKISEKKIKLIVGKNRTF